MRIVIFSHGHPFFSKGGAEIAAYNLFREINSRGEHTAVFIGRAQSDLMHAFTSLAMVGENEYLVAGNAGIENLTATTSLQESSDIGQLLQSIKPDVVHFHHYSHLGIELLRLVKNVCPNVRLVLTLHEFMAICLHNGQMVKTDGRLCYRYSPRECHLCFPHLTPEDIFLREQYIKSFFKLVDIFISPSNFLKERYVAWGIDERKITVLENGLPSEDRLAPRALAQEESRARFAYFGQINPYKGLDIILGAFARLPKSLRKMVSLDVFGSQLANQTAEYQQKINDLLLKCGGLAQLHGPYEPEEIGRLMAEVDWVIMGSIWWENSPLVIQEAYKFGRPVLCPDIGGMAEKVQPGIGGYHFRARDSVSLASLIKKVVADPGLFDQLQENLPSYHSIAEITSEHIQLYQKS